MSRKRRYSFNWDIETGQVLNKVTRLCVPLFHGKQTINWITIPRGIIALFTIQGIIMGENQDKTTVWINKIP